MRRLCSEVTCRLTAFNALDEPSPFDSMREATLTVSPNRQYLGIACPTTPAYATRTCIKGKGKGSLYSITERSVPELISVLCSQPAGDASHKPGGRLPVPLLFRQACSYPRNLKRAATNFAAW